MFSVESPSSHMSRFVSSWKKPNQHCDPAQTGQVSGGGRRGGCCGGQLEKQKGKLGDWRKAKGSQAWEGCCTPHKNSRMLLASETAPRPGAEQPYPPHHAAHSHGSSWGPTLSFPHSLHKPHKDCSQITFGMPTVTPPNVSVVTWQ